MILMHRDIPTAKISLIAGRFYVDEIYNASHMPLGSMSKNPNLTSRAFQNWIGGRAIPNARQNIGKVEKAFGCSVTTAMSKSPRASLTDCYWVREEEDDKRWTDVNYHINGFHSDIAAAIYHGIEAVGASFNTPDLTTDGILEKAWISVDGVSTLLKSGDAGVNAEGKNLLSANEIIACKTAALMGIPCVDYTPVTISGTSNTLCACESFIQDDRTEFVTFWQLRKQCGNDTPMGLYSFLYRSGFKKNVDNMIVLDHILHNTDRHEKNAGILRDPDNLDVKSFCPLFDSGSILAWNRSDNTVDMGETKPFINDRKEQLKLADLSVVCVPNKGEIESIIKEWYEYYGISEKCYINAIEDLSNSYHVLKEVSQNSKISVSYHRNAGHALQ